VGLLVVLAALLKWLGTAATKRGTVVRHAAIAFFLVLAAGAETVAARSYQRHWRDTLSLYSYLLAIEPNATVLNTGMGVELEQHGRTEEAIVHYRRALKTSPDDKIARANLAVALQRLGGAHNAEAKEHYLRVLEAHPDLVPARLNLGSLVLSEGNVDRAIDHYREAVNIAPDNVVAHYNLGKAMAFAGLPEEGLRELRAALRVSPRHIPVMQDLAWFLATHPSRAIRDPNEAVTLAERSRNITGGRDARSLAILAAAYACDGQYKKASETGQKALIIARRLDRDELAADVEEQLRLYGMGLPYLEAPRVQLDRLVAETKSQADQAQADTQDATENLELETK